MSNTTRKPHVLPTTTYKCGLILFNPNLRMTDTLSFMKTLPVVSEQFFSSLCNWTVSNGQPIAKNIIPNTELSFYMYLPYRCCMAVPRHLSVTVCRLNEAGHH